jgi:SH3-like domain-containing protein
MNALRLAPTGLVVLLLAAGAATAQTPAATPGHHAAAKPAGKAAPVVAAPANAHAQKARPGTAGKAATGAATEPAKPAEPAEPPRPAAAAEPPKGSVTGMPLPRWASLKSDEVNLRKGPGTRYPIEWVYRRHDLPVQIEREYEVWRLVEDQDGVKGWVHQANLTGRRSFVVKGSERVLHHAGAEDSAAVARLRPGVVGHIRACEAHATWCEVQVGEYRGWLKRDDMFGIYAGEAVP